MITTASIKTICVTLKVSHDILNKEFERLKWIETLELIHNFKYFNLTKNMPNSQKNFQLSKSFFHKSLLNNPVLMLWVNIYDIHFGLLAVAAVNRYIPGAQTESIAVLSDESSDFKSETFILMNKHFGAIPCLALGAQITPSPPSFLIFFSK